MVHPKVVRRNSSYLKGFGTYRIGWTIIRGRNAYVRTGDRGRTGKGRIDVVPEGQKSPMRGYILRLITPFGMYNRMMVDALLAIG